MGITSQQLKNLTLFSEHKAGLVKIIGQNHQFLAWWCQSSVH
jgi:hypothetical protein